MADHPACRAAPQRIGESARTVPVGGTQIWCVGNPQAPRALNFRNVLVHLLSRSSGLMLTHSQDWRPVLQSFVDPSLLVVHLTSVRVGLAGKP